MNSDNVTKIKIQISYRDIDDVAGKEHLSNAEGVIHTEAGVDYVCRAALIRPPSLTISSGGYGYGGILVARQSDMDDWITRDWYLHVVKVWTKAPGAADWTLLWNCRCSGISRHDRTQIEFGLTDNKAAFHEYVSRPVTADGVPHPITLGTIYSMLGVPASDGSYALHNSAIVLNDARDGGLTVDSNPRSVADGGDGTSKLGNRGLAYIDPAVLGVSFSVTTCDGDVPSLLEELMSGTVLGATPGYSAWVDSSSAAAYPQDGIDYAFHWQEPIRYRDAIDEIMTAAGGYWYVDNNYKIFIGRLDLPDPDAVPDHELTADDIVVDSLSLVETVRAASKIRIHYQRNYSVHSPDQISELAKEDVRKKIAVEYQVSEQINTRYSADKMQSNEVDYRNNIADIGSAFKEMARRLNSRFRHSFVFEFATTTLPSIGDQITVTYPADGFEDPRRCRVISVTQTAGHPIYTVAVWTGAAGQEAVETVYIKSTKSVRLVWDISYPMYKVVNFIRLYWDIAARTQRTSDATLRLGWDMADGTVIVPSEHWTLDSASTTLEAGIINGWNISYTFSAYCLFQEPPLCSTSTYSIKLQGFYLCQLDLDTSTAFTYQATDYFTNTFLLQLDNLSALANGSELGILYYSTTTNVIKVTLTKDDSTNGTLRLYVGATVNTYAVTLAEMANVNLIAFTYDKVAKSAQLYLNTTLAITTTNAAFASITFSACFIGGNNGLVPRHRVDELMFFDWILDSTEISALHSQLGI